MMTKLDIKIKWNQMSRDKIEKQNHLQKTLKAKQIVIKKQGSKLTQIQLIWHF